MGLTRAYARRRGLKWGLNVFQCGCTFLHGIECVLWCVCLWSAGHTPPESRILVICVFSTEY
jgi:hypothetical protein